ncbi:23S rRNA (uridine2552-2'-O)-methyltransferase [Nitrosomonas sp. Nm51]|uniref:RlmE family RNA methyltransferase n=1 Tax=Nitrosomonas sp. Nm51 TaxID=133720 RepID=UPI0008BD66D3|nr:RlmE family RNA methyltransferase [Nitrosomonas sp. Nm51]SER52945.1 23S rRNA (uridine2552-2'-O)-methyltransferase [Nitrosomonas sp. Nm51]
MARAKTSKAWMQAHVNDSYVNLAKKNGFRSRAAYKLLEINERDRILKKGMVVVDLGAAPGSWSQVAAQLVGSQGSVIALDILEMQPLPGVLFIQNDFREDSAVEMLDKILAERCADAVISDMAPNISGISVSDQARSMYLAELALHFAMDKLNYGGNFLVKVFHGSGFDQFLQTMRSGFKKVLVRKPKASRDRSNEIYLLGLEKKL